MIEPGYAFGVILAMSLITFALRALPFVAARWLHAHPLVERLGRFLPLAIMVLLLLHALRGAAQEDPLSPWPELLAITLVILLQWRSRNALLSIVLGTSAYVLMRNPGIWN